MAETLQDAFDFKQMNSNDYLYNLDPYMTDILLDHKQMMGEYDEVSCPKHYTEGRKFEPIDVIEDWNLSFHLGNALKYISRAGKKGNYITDIQKAIFYLERDLKNYDNRKRKDRS